MKLCIPTTTKDGQGAMVHEHFGSAPFFTVFDAETKAWEVIDNSHEHHAHGMCQPLASLAGRNIDVVVCGGMGARAVQKFNEAGIKVYRAVQGTVSDIARLFSEGALEEITLANSCAHHTCR
jgi:predicted Fe-Mo cluster-binding NifX family protein